MGPSLDVRHLRLLTAIADEGGLTRAASRLHLTQPALSRQLRDAEERLGTPLFLRTGRRLLPTPAGQELLVSARRVLADLEESETRARALDGRSQGRVRIATECYTCYHWLPPVLRRFAGTHPGVDVAIVLEATRGTAQALTDGRLDVALLSREPPEDRRLKARTLFRDELVAVMAPDHELAGRKRVRASDLAGQTVLVYPPLAESFVLIGVLRPAAVEPRRVVEVPLTEAILELAAAGEGVAVLARWAARPWADAGRVTLRPLAAPGARRTWRAVTLASDQVPECVGAFVDALAAAGAPGPPGLVLT